MITICTQDSGFFVVLMYHLMSSDSLKSSKQVYIKLSDVSEDIIYIVGISINGEWKLLKKSDKHNEILGGIHKLC